MISKHGFTTSTALLLALGMLQVLADPTPYKGTATLCFIGAVPPTVKQAGEDGVSSVSDLVSLYYIQTAPPGAAPPCRFGEWVGVAEKLAYDKKSMINHHTYQWVERHNACQALAIYANLNSLCNLGPGI